MDAVSKTIRANILRISHASGHGHLPTCFSVIEMIRAVYEIMQHQAIHPSDPKRDIFILSKGHAALAHYAVLAHNGYFPIQEVSGIGSFHSRFGCHADRCKVPGVEWSTGSLGHGICAAVGFALAIKLKNEKRRAFVIIGDGESNEGTVWEALQVAAHLKLDNLVIMLDWNQSQSRCLPIAKPVEKFRSMGCQTHEIDGHNMTALHNALAIHPEDKHPLGLICHTGKGYGCATLLKDMYAWHRRSPNAEELKQLLAELDNA